MGTQKEILNDHPGRNAKGLCSNHMPIRSSAQQHLMAALQLRNSSSCGVLAPSSLESRGNVGLPWNGHESLLAEGSEHLSLPSQLPSCPGHFMKQKLCPGSPALVIINTNYFPRNHGDREPRNRRRVLSCLSRSTNVPCCRRPFRELFTSTRPLVISLQNALSWISL